MKEKAFCPKCGNELKQETDSVLSLTYPYFCEECDENFMGIETADYIVERCPHCEMETKLHNRFELQECEHCHKQIAPCSLCDQNICDCKNCPFAII